MSASSAHPLTVDRAWSCVMMNFATPGTGTLKARRIFSGICQLGFALAGFFLVCAWIIEWCYRIFQAQVGEPVSQHATGWLWQTGAICIGVSWIWTLFTCIDLMRQAKKNERENRQNIPPKLADLPKQNPEK